MRFLAVDIGASSGRTLVGTVEAGHLTLRETCRFDHTMQTVDGALRWDVRDLAAKVRAAVDAAGPLDGIGIDTWGVDYGLLDAEGELLDLPFAYRDVRHATAMPEVYERVGGRERLYARTGLQELPFNTIFQLVAEQRERPDLVARAERMLLVPELLTYFLTGRAKSEYSIASTTGLLAATRRDWDRDLLRDLDLPERLFGVIQMPGTRAGAYGSTPVYLPAMHDTASAVAAVPATEPRGTWAYLSSGTWSLLGTELAEPILSPEAQAANFTNEGGVDGTIRFLKNINGLWLLQECRRVWAARGRVIAFAEMAAAAEASDFRATIDPNDPRYLAPNDMVHEIQTDLRASGEPVPESVGDVARCCYKSLAQAYGTELRRLEAVTGRRFERLYVVGGGAKADLLNRLTARAVGITVHAGPVEATALGNLGVQARACGLFEDLGAVRRAIAAAFPPKIYEPSI